MKGKSNAEVFSIPPSSAKAFEVKRGSLLKIINTDGSLVGDLVSFVASDLKEKFSAGRTRIENGMVFRVTKGDMLLSNLCNAMFEIVEDTSGVHDLLYPPCSRWVFEHRYKIPPRDGCLENLAKVLSPWNIGVTDIPDPLNVFMDVGVADSRSAILETSSKKGDYISLTAKVDSVVALSVCPVMSEAKRHGSLRVELSAPAGGPYA